MSPDLHAACGGGVIHQLEDGNEIIGRFPIARICMSCGETWADLATYRELRREFGGSIVTPFGSDAWYARERETGP